MPKEEWGTKRLCPHCATRFYDLNNDPMTCPACNNAFTLESLTTGRSRSLISEKTSSNDDDQAEIVDDADLDDDADTGDHRRKNPARPGRGGVCHAPVAPAVRRLSSECHGNWVEYPPERFNRKSQVHPWPVRTSAISALPASTF